MKVSSLYNAEFPRKNGSIRRVYLRTMTEIREMGAERVTYRPALQIVKRRTLYSVEWESKAIHCPVGVFPDYRDAQELAKKINRMELAEFSQKYFGGAKL